MENYEIQTKLASFETFEETRVSSSISSQDIEDLEILLKSLDTLEDYMQQTLFIPNYKLQKAAQEEYYKPVKLRGPSKENHDIAAKLAARPWAIILSTNQPLAKAETQDYTEELLDEKSFLESVNKIWSTRTETDTTVYKAIVQTLDTFYDKIIADNLDKFNATFSKGADGVIKFNKTIEKYTGSNLLSISNGAISSTKSAISSGIAQISTAMRSSNKDLAAMLGAGIAKLRGSILDPTYLNTVKADGSTEPVKPLDETFVIGKKGKYGPTFLPGRYEFNGLDYKEILLKVGQVKIFHGEREPLATVDSQALTELAKKIEKLAYKQEQQATAKETSNASYEAIDDINGKRVLADIIRSLDAQQQYFIAYFSTVYQGKEALLSLQTPGNTENPYFYYFYTNNFSIRPAKKAVTDIVYGAYETSLALEKTDSNSNFSFELPLDIQLSFWQFVMQEGLGVNTSTGTQSMQAAYDSGTERQINLNFVFQQAIERPTENNMEVLSTETCKVNHFVLENVCFTNINELRFQQTFGQSKSTIKGIYKRLVWHHNKSLTDFLPDAKKNEDSLDKNQKS